MTCTNRNFDIIKQKIKAIATNSDNNLFRKIDIEIKFSIFSTSQVYLLADCIAACINSDMLALI